ncbi:MAG TPA: hypothetical protein VMJ10_37030 [Kofleriaceae bacterium]|nr:hypothetical protein [Kofleriaceae bacterium]
MRIPVWLTLGVAAIVLTFGSYRIYLALRKRETNEDAAAKGGMMGGGFYRMSPRAHMMVGVIYLLLGAALVATSFGVNPIGGLFGPSTETPPKDQAPVKGSGGIPIDTIKK